MSLSLGAYQSAVLAALGNPPTDVVTNEEIDGAVNDSYFEILRLFPHRRMKRDTTVTTTDGLSEYALPADYWWMRIVKDETNTQRLTHRSLEWIENEDDGSTGSPFYWTSEDQNIRLYPTPDDELTVRLWYVARPSPLVSPTDTDILGDEFNEVVKLGAIARAFYINGEYDRQVHSENMQRRHLRRMIEAEPMEKNTGLEIAGPLTAYDDVGT